jgi:hypothetical protein
MMTNDTTNGQRPAPGPYLPAANTLLAGFLAWAAISAGFFALKMLMEERPEFVGQPASKLSADMIQESPWVVTRKMSDDVSVIKAMQPEHADVRFNMAGRRDYRGLRTIMDMSGEFHAQFGLSNGLDEAVFVLFKCPHPRNGIPDGGSLAAGGLRLQSSVDGVQENGSDAWLWSGALEAHRVANIDISYQVAALKSATYRVGDQNGNPVKQLRVAFQRRDLDSMRFESGDGTKASTEETVSWERRDFLAPDFYTGAVVESRSLYQSLSQLLEIGPGICLLFLLAVSAVVLARQELNPVQIVTIAVGYGLYFPLILYQSAHLSFPVAVGIAAVVPGVLLLNYARWLLGARIGLLGGMVCLLLYWVFPTWAAFAGWNRGMVLLCLGVVTLYVLIDLQNQAFRRKAAVVALLATLLWPGGASAAEAQVIVPGELLAKAPEAKKETRPALVAFAPAQYQVKMDTNYFRVEALATFQILRAGDSPKALFSAPVYLLESHIESPDTNLAWIIGASNGLWLEAERSGPGTLRLSYRVPIEDREGKRRAEIPVLAGVSGNAKLEAARNDLEILTGSLWSKSAADKATVYDIGVTGEGKLTVEWRDHGNDSLAQPPKMTAPLTAHPAQPPKPPEPAKDFYGIGLTRAQHLTVVNSDGSCTHFAEFEMPAFQGEEFRIRLPVGARLISVSVNGNEIQSPVVEDQYCRVKLPGREAQQTVDRLSFRISYPPFAAGVHWHRGAGAARSVPDSRHDGVGGGPPQRFRGAGYFQRLGNPKISTRLGPLWGLRAHPAISRAHLFGQRPGPARLGWSQPEVSADCAWSLGGSSRVIPVRRGEPSPFKADSSGDKSNAIGGGASVCELIEKPLACIKMPDRNNALWTGRF